MLLEHKIKATIFYIKFTFLLFKKTVTVLEKQREAILIAHLFVFSLSRKIASLKIVNEKGPETYTGFYHLQEYKHNGDDFKMQNKSF